MAVMYLGVCAMHYNYLSVKNKYDELQTALDIKSDYIKVLETTIDTKTKEENERLKVEQQVVDFYIGHIERVNNPPSVENVMAIESDSKKENKEDDSQDTSSDSEENELIETVFESEEYLTPVYNGSILTASSGVNYYGSQRETYYNLDMSGCIDIMRSMGNTDEYWVREDGCKMLGNYIMCAANLDVYPRGSLVETSLGTAIVVDTGGFADSDPYQIDIAVTW